MLEYLDFFQSRGVGVINASAVGMGLLTGGDIPPWHPASTLTKDACTEATKLCKTHNWRIGKLGSSSVLNLNRTSTWVIFLSGFLGIAVLALEWALSQKCIPTTLVSITSEEQLDENINVLKTSLQRRKDGHRNKFVEEKLMPILKSIVCTQWENIEVNKYWKEMEDINCKQNQG